MNKRTKIIGSISIILVLIALGLILWLVILRESKAIYDIIHLDGTGIGDEFAQTYAFTRLSSGVHIFWWLFRTDDTEKPLIVWLDGLIGTSPSLKANFLSFGPYDVNLNLRNDSWIQDYNLLFIDAPAGTGFSFVDDNTSFTTTDSEIARDVLKTISSVFDIHPELRTYELYLFGQGYGGKIAAYLANHLVNAINTNALRCNFKSVILANPIIAPTVVLKELGPYLYQWSFVDSVGRQLIDELTNEIEQLTNEGEYVTAYEKLSVLEALIQSEIGAVAINFERLTDKMTRNQNDGNDIYYEFMNEIVASSLGIHSYVTFDGQRDLSANALAGNIMESAIDEVTDILKNSEIDLWICNGNLDAISNTPGQMQWIKSLEWSESEEFHSSSRYQFAVNGLLQGSIKEYGRFHLVWINSAGVDIPIDSSEAIRELLTRITGT